MGGVYRVGRRKGERLRSERVKGEGRGGGKVKGGKRRRMS